MDPGVTCRSPWTMDLSMRLIKLGCKVIMACNLASSATLSRRFLRHTKKQLPSTIRVMAQVETPMFSRIMEDCALSTLRNNLVTESFEAVSEVTLRALQHRFKRIRYQVGLILTHIRIGPVSRVDKFLANNLECRKIWSIVSMQGAQKGRLWSTSLSAPISKLERSNECQSVRIKVLESLIFLIRPVASETKLGIQI